METLQSPPSTTNEDKIWEKAWTLDEMKHFSTSWSLAGDSGLLLHLKQFSENILTKSVTIEKELQKLSYDEQQCNINLDNVTSKFLVLENTQFIENRVYEDDHQTDDKSTPLTFIDSIIDIKNEKEKTKEEKEAHLQLNINDSVSIGMSIMDNYFQKLDARKMKKNLEYGDDDDDDLEEDDVKNDLERDNQNENDKQTDSLDNLDEDLIVYETKDPYLLRCLPYLIGTDSYLYNDHIGLRDLDDDDDDEDDNDDDDNDENNEDDDDQIDKDHQQADDDDDLNQQDKEDSTDEDDTDDKEMTKKMKFKEPESLFE
jgi:WASH complex subunit FAM21